MREKLCTKCKETKPLDMFYGDKNQRSGLTCWCKECHKAQSLRYRKENPKDKLYGRRWWLQNRYGISLEEYESLLLSQEGKCIVCHKVCSSGRSLAVDHCHTTGKVRGLLCRRCNTAIGLLGDTYEGVQRAADYLRSVQCG